MKRVLPWASRALAVAGIIFLVVRLREYAGQIDLSRFDTTAWVLVAGLVLCYSLANLMLAFAWWNLLSQSGGITSYRWALRTYGVTQVAKYIPGNVFQFVGRQALGTAARVPGWNMARSALKEVILLAATAVLFGLLALPLVVTGMTVPHSIAAFATGTGLAAFGLRHFFGARAARALGLYVGFHAVSGALFIALLALVATKPAGLHLPWLPLGGAYVLAWVAGFLTPGVPAGLGVREAVLLLLFRGMVHEADLLLAIVMARVVTIGGDVLFFGLASAMRPEEQQET